MSQPRKKRKLPHKILGKSTQQLTLLHFRKEPLSHPYLIQTMMLIPHPNMYVESIFNHVTI